MDAAIIWSSVLTAAISLLTWTIKSKFDEMQRGNAAKGEEIQRLGILLFRRMQKANIHYHGRLIPLARCCLPGCPAKSLLETG